MCETCLYVCVCVCICQSTFRQRARPPLTCTPTNTHTHPCAAAFWQKMHCKKQRQSGCKGFCISCASGEGIVRPATKTKSTKKKKLSKEKEIADCTDEDALWDLWVQYGRKYTKPQREALIKRLNTFPGTQIGIDAKPSDLNGVHYCNDCLTLAHVCSKHIIC